MQGWHTTYLGMRELPREISTFEMQAFFTFECAEREVIDAPRSNPLKLGLAGTHGNGPRAGKYVSLLHHEMERCADGACLLILIRRTHPCVLAISKPKCTSNLPYTDTRKLIGIIGAISCHILKSEKRQSAAV